MRCRPAIAATVAALLATTLTGCSGSSGESITVSVPTSLQSVMASIASSFEHDHPGTHVTVGGPNAVRDADVIATDDEAAMDRLGKRVVTPRRFASNSLVIVVPIAATAHIDSFRDLSRPELRVVVCSERLPCGSAVLKVERLSGVSLLDPIHVESGEAAVSYAVSGRADAALAYRTQALPGEDTSLRIVDDPVFAKAMNRYPIAVARSSDGSSLAADFIGTVIGPVGGRALAAAGFGPPSG